MEAKNEIVSKKGRRAAKHAHPESIIQLGAT
jgi:hypothetical protein